MAINPCARAQFWVDRGVTYSQQRSAPDSSGFRYRCDCSGLVLMAWDIGSTNYNTASFLRVPGVITLGSIHDLKRGDAMLKSGHIELFSHWKDASNHQAGAYVYSFNTDGETVRNPTTKSNRGNLGFNSWSEMQSYRAIRCTRLGGGGSGGSPSRPTLRRGNTGASVTDLQKLLNKHGAKLDIDGDFGPKTEAAVREFQKAKKIGVDGIVGPVTWSKLLA